MYPVWKFFNRNDVNTRHGIQNRRHFYDVTWKLVLKKICTLFNFKLNASICEEYVSYT